MSYVVLARKYRPQTFADLTGQEHVSRTLQNAIDSGRVAHAFLFTGARGVGKTVPPASWPRHSLRAGASTEPCNVCHLAGRSPAAPPPTSRDRRHLTPVDDVRERDNSRYPPSHNRYKIYIIDEVHTTPPTPNALLKILEKPPPPQVHLRRTEPHKVPITILSRCQPSVSSGSPWPG